MPIPRLKTTENNYTDVDYSKLEQDLRIYLNKEYDKPPVCIEISQQGYKYRFGTFGNFSVIGGKSKAKKGFVVSAILGSAIGNQNIMHFKSYFQDKNIVLFDTEQGDYDLHIAAKRAMRLNQMQSQPYNFYVYALRQLETIDRVAFIEHYLEKNKNIGLVIIDGIRDLLIDINSTDQATELTTKLMQWTKIYNLHACVVLHENPGSDKLRGHIGTEIMNKAETVISVEKTEERDVVSMIIPKYTRGTMPFKEFSFEINEHGLPELSNYEPVF